MTEDYRQVTPDDFDELNIKTAEMERIAAPQPKTINLDQESARRDMVKHTYETPPARMSEMTYLGRHETANLAFMEMFDAMMEPDYVVGSAFRVWRQAFYALRRSVGGRHLGKAYQLAEAGMLTEEKEATGMAMDLE